MAPRAPSPLLSVEDHLRYEADGAVRRDSRVTINRRIVVETEDWRAVEG